MTIKPLAMIKRYHIPAIAFLLFTSTVALLAQKSIYTFPFENSYRLPPMSVYINTEEIASTYQTLGNLYTTEITGLGEEIMEQTSTTMISDVKAVDAIRFLEFYMQEQLVTPGDETSGAVEMSIIYYHVKHRVNLGTALNILTFGIGGLLGIPFSTAITDVEVEATFFDDSNRYISTHRGVGRAKMLETIYNMSSSGRTPHQKAIRRALTDLNEKVMTDPKLVPVSASAIVPEP